VSRQSTRRQVLRLCGAGLPAVAAACARREPPDRRTRVALAELEASGRVEIEVLGEPAEVIRSESGLVARSLLCSHFGCRVEWQPGRGRYHCPCHQGEFDAEGKPVAGPPTQPLRLIPTEISSRDILVGER